MTSLREGCRTEEDANTAFERGFMVTRVVWNWNVPYGIQGSRRR